MQRFQILLMVVSSLFSMSSVSPSGAVGVETFRRGDVTSDGLIDLTDAVSLLDSLFQGGERPTCADAADANDANDANDDGSLDLTDAVVILDYLFFGGAPTPYPGPDSCGADLTFDTLDACVSTCAALAVSFQTDTDGDGEDENVVEDPNLDPGNWGGVDTDGDGDFDTLTVGTKGGAKTSTGNTDNDPNDSEIIVGRRVLPGVPAARHLPPAGQPPTAGTRNHWRPDPGYVLRDEDRPGGRTADGLRRCHAGAGLHATAIADHQPFRVVAVHTLLGADRGL